MAGWAVLAVSSEFCFLIWGVARVRDAGVSVAEAAALSSAFPIGMALGRLVGPWLIARGHSMIAGCLTAMAGTGAFCTFQDRWPVTGGLAIAGLGIAVLYPVTLARLVGTPGLPARHSASLGALASGTAILTAPALLGAANSAVSLRVAFLFPILLLAALLAMSRNHAGGTR